MEKMVKDEYGLHVKEWKADPGKENGLRRPRQLYNFIKQSYEGLN